MKQCKLDSGHSCDQKCLNNSSEKMGCFKSIFCPARGRYSDSNDREETLELIKKSESIVFTAIIVAMEKSSFVMDALYDVDVLAVRPSEGAMLIKIPVDASMAEKNEEFAVFVDMLSRMLAILTANQQTKIVVSAIGYNICDILDEPKVDYNELHIELIFINPDYPELSVSTNERLLIDDEYLETLQVEEMRPDSYALENWFCY